MGRGAGWITKREECGAIGRWWKHQQVRPIGTFWTLGDLEGDCRPRSPLVGLLQGSPENVGEKSPCWFPTAQP